MNRDISDFRQDYRVGKLVEADMSDDPILQFRQWFDSARDQVKEPNAMTLATVFEGQPQARIVLLKELDDQGFVFFTNYESDKGSALAQTPRAALCFWWEPLERQVRIQGRVEKISPEASTEYFHSRPRTSQLGAWASAQSKPLADDHSLQAQFDAAESRFADLIPRPEHWGGYRVVPDRIEFWQGRSSRLHDRFDYRLDQGQWIRQRLSP